MTDSTGAAAPSRWRRPLWVGVAAGVAGLALGLGGAALVGGHDGHGGRDGRDVEAGHVEAGHHDYGHHDDGHGEMDELGD